ncbi:hypothetical protein E2C01_093984 [Portunus trituberculatus]|uniref:Uncharacterized protein n=1 Tax=Portunus trituberculatus TaxID=210409 RepID=A0A5B7JP85_PORTR|nr:hypothetical protein [Portunus trituberculatus]
MKRVNTAVNTDPLPRLPHQYCVFVPTAHESLRATGGSELTAITCRDDAAASCHRHPNLTSPHSLASASTPTA